MTRSILTADKIRRLFEYDPNTGTFIRLVTVAPNAKAGDTAGSTCGDGYLDIGIDGRSYKAHVLAWLYMTGEWPSYQVDHKNCQNWDNRWENLRSATHQQNAANSRIRKDNSTGFKGVRKIGHRYQARIAANGSGYIGMFDTAEEAHNAYIEAAKLRYGEFAREI